MSPVLASISGEYGLHGLGVGLDVGQKFGKDLTNILGLIGFRIDFRVHPGKVGAVEQAADVDDIGQRIHGGRAAAQLVVICAGRDDGFGIASVVQAPPIGEGYGYRVMAQTNERAEAGVTYANRPQGATTGAWPGFQPFGGWKGSGSTGKAIGSYWYLPLYLREQSQTVVD